MKTTRFHRTLLANVYGQLVTLFVQLFTIPMFLSYWGPTKYSTWLALMAVPNMLSQGLAGIASSSGTLMVLDSADHGDGAAEVDSQLARTFNASLLLTIASSVAIVTLAIAFGGALRIKQSALLVPLAAALVSTQLVLSVVVSGFQASRRFATAFSLQHTCRLCSTTGGLLSVSRGGGFAEVATCMLLPNCVGLLVACLFLFATDRRLLKLRETPRRSDFKRLLKPFLADAMIPLGQGLRLNGPIWILKSLTMSSEVVLYSTLQTMANSVFQLPRVLNRAAQQELSVAHGERNHSKSNSMYRKLVRANMLIALGGGVLLLAFGKYPFEMLVRGNVVFSRPLLCIILMAACFSVYNWVNITLLKSRNRHFAWSACALVLWVSIAIASYLFNGMTVTSLACLFAIGELSSAWLSRQFALSMLSSHRIGVGT